MDESRWGGVYIYVDKRRIQPVSLTSSAGSYLCVRKRQKYKQAINKGGADGRGNWSLGRSSRRNDGGGESHLEITIII